jgi:hypothetical protein
MTSTDILFEPIKEDCPICQSTDIFKLNGMLVCSQCGDYLILKPKDGIKEKLKYFKTTKN